MKRFLKVISIALLTIFIVTMASTCTKAQNQIEIFRVTGNSIEYKVANPELVRDIKLEYTTGYPNVPSNWAVCTWFKPSQQAQRFNLFLFANYRLRIFFTDGTEYVSGHIIGGLENSNTPITVYDLQGRHIGTGPYKFINLVRGTAYMVIVDNSVYKMVL